MSGKAFSLAGTGVSFALLCLLHSTASAAITGQVYHDSNQDGFKNNETGITGVTVTAYATDGTQADQTTSGPDGTYTLTSVADFTNYRLEFTDLPAGFTPGPNGIHSKSGVHFTMAPSINSHYGLVLPKFTKSCSTNDSLVISSFRNGVPSDPSHQFSYSVTKHNYMGNGLGQTGTNGATNITQFSKTGPIWGLAYDGLSGALYSSSVVKRHIGAGPDGIGAIYRQTDLADMNSISLFYDFGPMVGNIENNTTRFPGTGAAFGEEGQCATCDNLDDNAFDWAGKRAFGDLDLTLDGKTLYVTNLFDRKLYSINTEGTPSHTEVNAAPWLSNADCKDNANGTKSGIARPWAVTIKDTDVYVGVVCDASSSNSCNTTQSCADLTAHVYKYDGSAWSTVLAASTLDYPRSLYRTATGSTGTVATDPVWHPWVNAFADISSSITAVPDGSYPQPILGDIEFADDGHMILSFLDRSSLQFGYAAPAPGTNSSNVSIRYFSAGDLLRATVDNGTYTLETTEFYKDQWRNSGSGVNLSGDHNDPSTGGLAVFPSLKKLVQGTSDAIDPYGAGFVFMSTVDGNVNAAQEVYQSSSNGSDSTFAKAGGLGDIEVICPITPPQVEIGNRVWCDNGANGIQDAGEAGIENVTVRLSCGNEYVETTTDNKGNYLFTDSSWVASPNVTSIRIPRNSECTVSIDSVANKAALNAGCSSTNAIYTTSNAPSGLGDNLDDVRDSDGEQQNNLISTTINTNNQNNHTIDFGFRDAPVTVDVSLAKIVDKPSAKPSETVVYTLTARNDGAVTATGVAVTDNLPAGLSYISNNASQGSYDANTGIWTIGDLAVGASVTLTLTVTVD